MTQITKEPFENTLGQQGWIIKFEGVEIGRLVGTSFAANRERISRVPGGYATVVAQLREMFPR